MVDNNITGIFSSLKHALIKILDPDYHKNTHQEAGFNEQQVDSEFRINEAVSNKAKTIINDFIDAAPLIQEAGFRINDLQIELSVIPKLIPHFEKVSDVDEATRIRIIEQVKDKRIIRLLLKALFNADNFQQSLKMGNMEFAGIEIEITAIPAIRLLYKNPNTRHFTTTDLVD